MRAGLGMARVDLGPHRGLVGYRSCRHVKTRGDLRDLLANLLTLWFFATPIIYSYRIDSVKHYLGIFRLNPMYHVIVAYQESLFWTEFGHYAVLTLGVLSVLFFFAAYWLFDRLRDSFAEVV
jgi:ABC-type polysaccharide/polyol phosphate export permease